MHFLSTLCDRYDVLSHLLSTLCDRYDVLSHLFVWSSERTHVLFAQPLPISLDRVIKWDINFDIFRFYICQFHWQPFLRMSRDAFFLATWCFSHTSLKRQEKRNYLSLWEMVLYSVYRKRPHHWRYPRSVWFVECRKYGCFFFTQLQTLLKRHVKKNRNFL